MEELIGQSLDRYKVVSLLGEGGMGAVFKAHDVTLQRDVAIKVMHPQFARRTDFQERFLQEARTAARLSHPGIVQVFDFGYRHPHLYIVMEFIPGDNLRGLLQNLKAAEKWVSLPEAVQLLKQVCLTVHYVHQQGVLHRDIKPDNIMLRPEPSEGLPYRPVLTDLGLAKLVAGGLMTREGASMGTPAYMSPEQALGKPTDARSDVYSLGILLYELAVGQLPFPVRTITEAIRCHTTVPPPPPRSVRADVPESLERVILRALQKPSADRHPSAKAMSDALAGALSAVPVTSAPPGASAGAVSLMTQYQQSIESTRDFSILGAFRDIPPDASQDRVLVLNPDGTTRAVPIKGERLTIGRGTDNDLVLNHPKVSRNHAEVAFDGRTYTVTDLGSTNGTYLANVKLLPRVPEIWIADQALRIGDVWLRLQRAAHRPVDTAPPSMLDGDGFFDPGIIHTSAGTGRVGVFMATTKLSVEPGNSVAATLILLNQGTIVDHFRVSVDGMPSHWLPGSLPVVQLLPRAQQEVPLTILPSRTPKSEARIYPLTIRVASEDAPEEFATVAASLEVKPFYQFQLDLRPRKQSGMTEGNFRVEIDNRSNATVTLKLSASDPEEGCRYMFDPPTPAVAAGQGEVVSLTVQPGQALGKATTKSYPFTVTAEPVEAAGLAQQVQGVFEHTQPTFELTLRPQRQRSVADGSFRVIANNQSSTDLTLHLEGTDPEEGCRYIFDPPQVTVASRYQQLVKLRVQPKHPLPAATARSYPFTITARPHGMPGLTRQTEGEFVQIPPDFELTIHPQRQSGAGRGTFRVLVENFSDAELTVVFDAVDPEERGQYTFKPPQIAIPAGQQQTVRLEVQAKEPLAGAEARSYSFTVTGRPLAAPRVARQAQGLWEQIPAPAPAPRPTPPRREATALAKAKPRRTWGCAVFLIGIILTVAAGFLAGKTSYDIIRSVNYDLAEPASIAIAGVVWLYGLVQTIRYARKASKPPATDSRPSTLPEEDGR
jgi:serine/threonine protein kinase/uncharacterized membrane protein